MPPFCIGDQVLIQRGDRAGQRAEVVQAQRAEVYKVKMRDGSFLFYSERQLEGIHRQTPDAGGTESKGRVSHVEVADSAVRPRLSDRSL